MLIFQHLAKHVMQVHLNAAQTTQAQEGELSLNFLKKYISYCRMWVWNHITKPLPFFHFIIQTFIHLFIYLFIHFFIHPFIHSSLYSFIRCSSIVNVVHGYQRQQQINSRTVMCWWEVVPETMRETQRRK